MEKVYRGAMSDMLHLERQSVARAEDVREIIGRRELYRRMSRIATSVTIKKAPTTRKENRKGIPK